MQVCGRMVCREGVASKVSQFINVEGMSLSQVWRPTLHPPSPPVPPTPDKHTQTYTHRHTHTHSLTIGTLPNPSSVSKQRDPAAWPGCSPCLNNIPADGPRSSANIRCTLNPQSAHKPSIPDSTAQRGASTEATKLHTQGQRDLSKRERKREREREREKERA